MGYFDSEQEVYRYVGGVFRAAAEHEEVGPKLRGAEMTLRLCCTEPDAQLTVRFHDPVEVTEGASGETPDVQLEMRADDTHRFWLGEYNLAVGMAKREVRAKGPVNKLLKLVPLAKPLVPMYRQLVAEKEGA